MSCVSNLGKGILECKVERLRKWIKLVVKIILSWIPMKEWGGLGHPFPNLNKYSLEMELKLTLKNKMKSKKLNLNQI